MNAVKSAKAGLLDDIMETERQLLLWEKKIQLEKETQAALDPEVGMQEIHAMEKEIHRMKLRYTVCMCMLEGTGLAVGQSHHSGISESSVWIFNAHSTNARYP